MTIEQDLQKKLDAENIALQKQMQLSPLKTESWQMTPEEKQRAQQTPQDHLSIIAKSTAQTAADIREIRNLIAVLIVLFVISVLGHGC